MERVGTLINKLKEQYDQQVCADKLAFTVQLLLAELQSLHYKAAVTGKVSVVMPNISFNSVSETPDEAAAEASKEARPEETNWLFTTNIEIPTLVHQDKVVVPQLNDMLTKPFVNINEQLKEQKTEVATLLDDSPVRDLKKAVSVNDRYLFVNTLFRGDETMYERSIKTINGFAIFPEAQYWIQRELKVKLGWIDSNETVQLFDQLIKRRFS